MTKKLISVLAGMLVLGSAFAAPSVEDRRILCNRYPDKFVWVEKDQACVPINPCTSNDRDIKETYCGNWMMGLGDDPLQGYIDQQLLVTQKFAIKVLKTKINKDSMNIIGHIEDTGFIYVGYKLQNGGYVVFFETYGMGVPNERTAEFIDDPRSVYAQMSCGANGYIYDDDYGCDEVTQEECTDVADFASLLVKRHVGGVYNESLRHCRLIFDE